MPEIGENVLTAGRPECCAQASVSDRGIVRIIQSPMPHMIAERISFPSSAQRASVSSHRKLGSVWMRHDHQDSAQHRFNPAIHPACPERRLAWIGGERIPSAPWGSRRSLTLIWAVARQRSHFSSSTAALASAASETVSFCPRPAEREADSRRRAPPKASQATLFPRPADW